MKNAQTSPWIQRAVQSNYEISIFKKLGVSLKNTAPNARRLQTESRLASQFIEDANCRKCLKRIG